MQDRQIERPNHNLHVGGSTESFTFACAGRCRVSATVDSHF